MNLVKAAYEKGGFPGVNRLYTHPPESMEQVLHPEKYFAGDDPPIRVRVTRPAAFKAAGWKVLKSGTWGEFNIRLILQEWGADEVTARRASEGWGGDRFEVYEDPAGELAFAWATVWDTDRDATEFMDSVGKVRGLSIAREGRRVTLIKGAPAAGAVKDKVLLAPAA